MIPICALFAMLTVRPIGYGLMLNEKECVDNIELSASPKSAKRSIFSHTIRKVSQSSFGWNLELFVPPGNRNLGFGQYRERKRKPFYIRSRNPVEASRDQSNQMSIKFAELSSQKTKVQLP